MSGAESEILRDALDPVRGRLLVVGASGDRGELLKILQGELGFVFGENVFL